MNIMSMAKVEILTDPAALAHRVVPQRGLLVVNSQGNVQIVDISNAPLASPDLNGILKDVKFIESIRGTL